MGLAPARGQTSPRRLGSVCRIVICDRHACCHGIGCVPGSGFSRRSVRILAGGERRRHPHVRNCGVPRFHRLTRTSASHRRHLDGDPRRQTLDYRLAAVGRGIFSFDAGFYGSIPGIGLNPAGSGTPPQPQRPIVAIGPSRRRGRATFGGSDRGVFAFGDATFAGSCPGIGVCRIRRCRRPRSHRTRVLGPDPEHAHHFRSGDRADWGRLHPLRGQTGVRPRHATCFVSLPAGATTSSDSAAAIFVTDDHLGYWNATAQGKVYPFGDAPFEGTCPAPRSTGQSWRRRALDSRQHWPNAHHVGLERGSG